MNAAKPTYTQVWHRRLGHVCVATIKEMADKGVVDGLAICGREPEDNFCDGCISGKQHCLPSPTIGLVRSKKIGALYHLNLCGPSSTTTPGGTKYFVTFQDDYSGFCFINFVKQKSELFSVLKKFTLMVQLETCNSVVALRPHNGEDYVGRDFRQWMAEQGIRLDLSATYPPEQNGVAEGVSRTVLESARSMLHHSSLPLELWAEASNFAVYILNRVVGRSVGGKTPYEVWRGVKPNVSHIREFGSSVYVNIPKEGKCEPKPLKCVHVGFCEAQKAFRAWDPVDRKIIVTRDVIFQEPEDEKVVSSTPPSISDIVPDPFRVLADCHAANFLVADLPTVLDGPDSDNTVDDETLHAADPEESENCAGMVAVGDIEEPTNFKEATTSPQNCSARSVPADPLSCSSKDLDRDSSDKEAVDPASILREAVELAIILREAVESLVYLVNCTRPDSQSSKSPTGIVTILNEGPVWWKSQRSQRQNFVPLSPIGFEHIAESAGADKIWQLLQNLGQTRNQPTESFICDPRGTKAINTIHVTTESQLADLITKRSVFATVPGA